MSEGKPEFTFYDGPPFATGLPHYGHIAAGTIKVRIDSVYFLARLLFSFGLIARKSRTIAFHILLKAQLTNLTFDIFRMW